MDCKTSIDTCMGVLDNYVCRVYRNVCCINKPGLYKKDTYMGFIRQICKHVVFIDMYK